MACSKRTWRGRSLGLLAAVANTASGTALGQAEEAAPKAGDAPVNASAVEEIYILRSVRETRSEPSPDCATARTKVSDPAWEDQYTFHSVATRAADGRVVDDDAAPVGSIRACFGRTADPAVFELYGDLVVNGIAGKAFGKCTNQRSDFPETGVRLFACAFALFDLPAPYVGGQLTTNSVSTADLFGTRSNPPGYTQVSIATIRLWKPRT